MNFGGVATTTFSNGFILLTGSTCAVLMGFNDTAINKQPLGITLLAQGFKQVG